MPPASLRWVWCGGSESSESTKVSRGDCGFKGHLSGTADETQFYSRVTELTAWLCNGVSVTRCHQPMHKTLSGGRLPGSWWESTSVYEITDLSLCEVHTVNSRLRWSLIWCPLWASCSQLPLDQGPVFLLWLYHTHSSSLLLCLSDKEKVFIKRRVSWDGLCTHCLEKYFIHRQWWECEYTAKKYFNNAHIGGLKKYIFLPQQIICPCLGK